MIFKFKRRKKRRIKVYFLCQYIQGFHKISSIIECMKNNSSFEVKVLAIPNAIKSFPENKEYNYLNKQLGDIVVNAVCNDKWFDLRKEKPDYIFIQRPYDHYLPEEYRIDTLKQYTKLCYIPYGFELVNLRSVVMPDYFVKNISMMFCSQTEEYDYCIDVLNRSGENTSTKVFDLGYPSLYRIINKIKNYNSAFHKVDNKVNLNVLWTPRWTVDDELCKSSFFDYKDKIVKYMEKQKDINFVFRPHPLALNNFIDKKIMTKKQVKDYLNQFNDSNMYYDCSGDYHDTFIDSDILITDFSTIIIEYFVLNKPIIYCYSKDDRMTKLMKKMIKCFYCVNNWDELKSILENIKQGNDPLKSKRTKLVNEILHNYKTDVASKIVNEIKKDFYD